MAASDLPRPDEVNQCDLRIEAFDAAVHEIASVHEESLCLLEVWDAMSDRHRAILMECFGRKLRGLAIRVRRDGWALSP